MALIKCKECKEEVSSKAKTCPKCGAEVAKKSIGCGGLIGYFIVGAIAISWLSSLFSTNTKNITSPQISSAASTASIPPTPALPGSQWSYLTSDDKMGKGTIHHAFLSSSNSVNFEFPYAGIQHGTLSLRINPRYGKDIIFKIEKGQILCSSYDDCTVLVRFDNEPAVNYDAAGAEDHSTETLFIRNYNGFVKKMLEAKRVRIAANIYHQGAPVFEFDVSDFDQEKYKPKK